MRNITHTFYIEGMHCSGCALHVESTLSDLSYVESVKADLHKKTAIVTGDFDSIPVEKLAEDFSMLFMDRGYVFYLEKKNSDKNLSDYKVAVPLALAFLFFFILLQKIGVVNLVSLNKVSLGTSFVIGLIASISTCMAVVGGLVLSMSSTFSKEGNGARPEVMFHIGRLISFFIFGGVIGLLGSAFTLGSGSTFVLSLIVGLVMLLMALYLLDFHFAKRFQPTMPKFISKHALGLSKVNHILTPFLVGIATFFLPCGFTQSMQVYTLTTGSFTTGALTMFSFALGTLPVLALVSFGSLSISKSSWSGVFFKTAGIIVLAFALLNILNSLVVIGVIPPFLNI